MLLPDSDSARCHTVLSPILSLSFALLFVCAQAFASFFEGGSPAARVAVQLPLCDAARPNCRRPRRSSPCRHGAALQQAAFWMVRSLLSQRSVADVSPITGARLFASDSKLTHRGSTGPRALAMRAARTALGRFLVVGRA
eukprot:5242894-Pleurochrysis_carterae.AAC.7